MSRHGSDRRRPPALLRWIFGRLLPRGDRELLQVEMDALFRRRAAKHGRLRASAWYLRHTLFFPLRFGLERAARGGGAFGPALASTARDIRYGARTLLRRPSYTLATVATLGFGIGGVSAVYAAAHWVLLRDVPGVTATDLATVQMETQDGGYAFPMSDLDFRDLRDRVPSFRGLVAASEHDVHVQRGADGTPTRLSAEVVTPGFFQLLGMRATRGRLLSDGSAGPDGDAGTVVISHRLWQELWTGSSEALGATLQVNGHAYVVTGVAPPDFRGAELPGSVDLWLPQTAFHDVDPGFPADVLDQRSMGVWRHLVAHLAPAASPEQVTREADQAMQSVRDQYRASTFWGPRWVVRAYPGLGLSPRIRGSVRRTLFLMGVAALILLLLAVTNTAHLALTHAVARTESLAVHAALGAGKVRLARRMLTEHLLLGLGGALTGVGVATVVTRALSHASLSSLGASMEGVRLNSQVAGMALAIALGAGIAAGIVPAVSAARSGLAELLPGKRGGRRSTYRLQAGLVIAQVALSTLLLVGTGLVVHTAVNLRGFDLGFDPDGALRFAIDPRIQGYDDAEVAELVTLGRQRLTAIAGVQAAGFAAPELVSDSYYTYAVRAEGAPEDELVLAGQVEVSPGLLEALGARLDAGRLFLDEDMDTTAARTPVVVSRSVVTAAFGDLSSEAAIGRTLLVASARADGRQLAVVGVIEDPHFGGALGRDAPRVFLPWAGGFDFSLTAWVRAPGASGRVAAEVRRTMQEVDPELPVYDLRSGRAQADRIIVEQRVVARLALGLALVGLLLAGVELHGVLAYSVEQRRHEIGVRVALGAAPGTILGRFVGRGITLALVGATLGAGGAYWLTQFIRARLFGVQPLDPLTYLFGLAALVITAAVASWGPARRSLSVSPREALEAE